MIHQRIGFDVNLDHTHACPTDQVSPCESTTVLETAKIEVSHNSGSQCEDSGCAINEQLFKMDDFERTPNQIRWMPQINRLDYHIYGKWTVNIKSSDDDLIAAFNLVILPNCEAEPSPFA